MTSTPASSTRRAVGASYAVRAAIRRTPLRERRRGAVMGAGFEGRSSVDMKKPPVGRRVARDGWASPTVPFAFPFASVGVPSRGFEIDSPAPPVPRKAALPGSGRRGLLFRSARHVDLRAPKGADDLLDEVLEVSFPLHEVDLVRLYHQERAVTEVVEEVIVGLDEALEVIRPDSPLVGARPLLDPREARVDRGRQVDDEVGPRDRFRERRVEPVVRAYLFVGQRQVREDLVLGERVVGDDEVPEEVDLRDLALLLIAREEEVDLRLERGALLPGVEVREERVRDVLEDLRPREPLREQPDERRLPDADRPLDGDVPERKRLGSGSGQEEGSLSR